VGPTAGLNDVEKRKILFPPGLELRPLGRLASRYTDFAIPALRTENPMCSAYLDTYEGVKL
jgi:hypothetical protein